MALTWIPSSRVSWICALTTQTDRTEVADLAIKGDLEEAVSLMKNTVMTKETEANSSRRLIQDRSRAIALESRPRACITTVLSHLTIQRGLVAHLQMADIASLAYASRALAELLKAKAFWRRLGDIQHCEQRREFLTRMVPVLPRHYLCRWCEKFHPRDRPRNYIRQQVLATFRGTKVKSVPCKLRRSENLYDPRIAFIITHLRPGTLMPGFGPGLDVPLWKTKKIRLNGTDQIIDVEAKHDRTSNRLIVRVSTMVAVDVGSHGGIDPHVETLNHNFVYCGHANMLPILHKQARKLLCQMRGHELCPRLCEWTDMEHFNRPETATWLSTGWKEGLCHSCPSEYAVRIFKRGAKDKFRACKGARWAESLAPGCKYLMDVCWFMDLGIIDREDTFEWLYLTGQKQGMWMSSETDELRVNEHGWVPWERIESWA